MSPMRLKTLACLMAGLTWALAALSGLLAAPARAQFFIPFFDNRPAPPRELRPHPVFRPKPKKPHPHPAPQKRAPAKSDARPGSITKSDSKEKPAPPVVEAPPPPYEPQLLRLAEIMGALAVLQKVCGEGARPDAPQVDAQIGAQDAAWRDSMQKLMDSQDAGPMRRERLAGAYNRGLRGYQYSYRHCTPSAELARSRFLDEGVRVTHDISVHYKEN